MNTYWKVCFNAYGRDFVVGDVHGHRDQLMSQLAELRFDPSVDRLFFLGDIVDRGPDSAAMIEMVDQRTYFSILGNHEVMMIAGLEDPTSVPIHRSNGGDWFYDLSPHKQRQIINRVRAWPWAIEVDIGTKRVGFVHADVPDSNWEVVKKLLERIDADWSKGTSIVDPGIAEAAQPLLWRRSLINHLYQQVLELGSGKRTVAEYKRLFIDRYSKLYSADPQVITPFLIEGIDSVYMGHSYVPVQTTVGGCHFLDTYRGAKSEKLSIQCINSPTPR